MITIIFAFTILWLASLFGWVWLTTQKGQWTKALGWICGLMWFFISLAVFSI